MLGPIKKKITFYVINTHIIKQCNTPHRVLPGSRIQEEFTGLFYAMLAKRLEKV